VFLVFTLSPFLSIIFAPKEEREKKEGNLFLILGATLLLF
jgi:hypothetical protein